ncbi:MAG: MFS transporter [Fimbriimonadia bacterium]|nr:MFS transporter [Fimbriimonadia bacterium]
MSWSKIALAIVALVAFLDTFALAPALPNHAKSLGASAWLAGLIVGGYSLANLIGNFFSGAIIDRFGRKRPMVWSLGTAAVLITGYGFIDSAWLLLVLRLLHGLSGAVFVPAMFALIGDQSVDRARAMGRAGAIIGFVPLFAFPMAGIVEKSYGIGTLFFLVAGAMAVATVCAQTGLKERFQIPEERLDLFPMRALSLPSLQSINAITLGMTLAMGAMLVFRLPVLIEQAGLGPDIRGRILGLFALVSVLTMAFYRRGSADGRAWMGLVMMIVGTLLTEVLSLPNGVLGAMVIFGAGFGLGFPAIHLLAFDRAPEAMRGTSLAVMHAFYSLGYVLGPLMAGGFADLQVAAGYPVALTAALLLMVAAARSRSQAKAQ